MRRRASEFSFDWPTVFEGEGIDIGSGDDALSNCSVSISDSRKAIDFNLPDGGGDRLTDYYKDGEFSWIHSSQCLEHALDPVAMMGSWIQCLKPKGFICA